MKTVHLTGDRLRSVIGVAGLLAGSVLVCVIGLEGWLRWFDPQITEIHPNGLWALSPTRGCRLVPSFDGWHTYTDFRVRVTISAQGLRDRVYGAKPAGTFRILALGDSFTFGFGVEAQEAFPKRLEALLRQRRAPPAFEVINAGMPGYATTQERVFLAEEGWGFQPDLVLIGCFPYNDFQDNLLPVDRFVVANGYLYHREGYEQARSARGGLPIPWKGYLWAHFHAYRFLAQRYRALADRSFSGEAEGAKAVMPPASSPSPDRAGPPPADIDDRTFSVTARLIRAMADTVRARGAGMALVLIPDIKQARNPAPTEPPGWGRIKAFADEHGIPVIDLAPAFRAAERRGRTPELWYMNNHHWTASGHRLAAEVIHAALAAQRLIPDPF